MTHLRPDNCLLESQEPTHQIAMHVCWHHRRFFSYGIPFAGTVGNQSHHYLTCLCSLVSLLDPGQINSANFFAIQWAAVSPSPRRLKFQVCFFSWILSLSPVVYYRDTPLWLTILYVKLPCSNYCIVSISWLDSIRCNRLSELNFLLSLCIKTV